MTHMKQMCEACGEGNVTLESTSVETSKGICVFFHYKCDHCQLEYVDEELYEKNYSQYQLLGTP